MSVYIISVLSKEKIKLTEQVIIKEKMEKLYPNQIQVSHYKYDDRIFHEIDFDITDIIFHKEKIHEEIQKIIDAIRIIFETAELDCEIIGGYNDTDNAIVLYEESREENFKMFGLFATKSPISSGKPYYQSDTFVVYQSFEYDSMGVVF